MNALAATVYLRDYRPAPALIPKVELDIDLLSEEDARVTATLAVRRNPEAETDSTLVLDLDEVTVESVAVDGEPLGPNRWQADDRHLTIRDLPESFQLTTVSRIHPARNTKLMGIY